MKIPSEKLGEGGTEKISRDAVAFQPEGLAIEIEPLPLRARATIFLILLVIVSAVIWASLASIDRVVVANGRLVTRDPLIVLQPLEKSVIRELPVRVGDVVKKGEPVAILDPTFASADLSTYKSELSSLKAKIARLEAELRDFAPLTPDPDIEEQHRVMAARILAIRRREFRSRQDLSMIKEKQIADKIKLLKEKRKIVEKRLEVINELENIHRNLDKQKLARRSQLIDAINEKLKVNQELAEMEATEADLEKELLVVRADRENFESEWWRKVDEAIEEARQRAIQISNQIKKAERRSNLVSLTAPVDSIVLRRAQLSVGSVAESAQPVAWLVPLGTRLEGEVKIASKDIASVQTGNKVRIKLEALPFQKFGVLEGEIISVAPDTVSSGKTQTSGTDKTEDSRVVYVAIIKINRDQPNGLNKKIRLIPGMIITAEIQVGKRSVLSYFLYPIIRMFDEFGREPT